MKQLTAVLFVLVLLAAAASVATTQPYTYGRGGELLTQFTYLDHVWFTCTGLLLLWASIGGLRLRTRFTASVACLVGMLVFVHIFGEWPGYWALLERTAYQVGFVVVIFCILAWAGVRVRILLPRSSADESSPLGRLRWTVRDLLVGVAVTALLLAIIRNLRPVSVQWSYWNCVRLVDGALLALLAVAAAWLSLGNTGTLYRLVGFLGATGLLMVAEGFSERWLSRLWLGRPYPFSWQSDLPGRAEWLGLQGLLMAASLWVFRAYGYHLVWHRAWGGRLSHARGRTVS